MLLLTGKIEKAYLVHTFFVYTDNKITTFFSNWEPDAQQKFAMRIVFCCSEILTFSNIIIRNTVLNML